MILCVSKVLLLFKFPVSESIKCKCQTGGRTLHFDGEDFAKIQTSFSTQILASIVTLCGSHFVWLYIRVFLKNTFSEKKLG